MKPRASAGYDLADLSVGRPVEGGINGDLRWNQRSWPVERQLNRPFSFAKLRAGYGIRTHDVQLGKLTLYH